MPLTLVPRPARLRVTSRPDVFRCATATSVAAHREPRVLKTPAAPVAGLPGNVRFVHTRVNIPLGVDRQIDAAQHLDRTLIGVGRRSRAICQCLHRRFRNPGAGHSRRTCSRSTSRRHQSSTRHGCLTKAPYLRVVRRRNRLFHRFVGAFVRKVRLVRCAGAGNAPSAPNALRTLAPRDDAGQGLEPRTTRI